MKEFIFDLKLNTTIRVLAETEAEAEKMIRDHCDAMNCNGGAWPNGDPIVFEASVEGEIWLAEDTMEGDKD